MSKKSLDDYRHGAIGSLLDEYERAIDELKSVMSGISPEMFTTIADAETKDDDCRSIETIMNHVLRAGHGYNKYIRDVLAMESSPVPAFQVAHEAVGAELDRLIAATADVFESRPETTDEEITELTINSRWGVSYNIDQMLEHAIVHVLRHRRQIEKFILKLNPIS